MKAELLKLILMKLRSGMHYNAILEDLDMVYRDLSTAKDFIQAIEDHHKSPL